MGWDIAEAKVKGKTIGYLYYDSTGDCVFPIIFKTRDEVHWEKGILALKTPEKFSCFCPNLIDKDGHEVFEYGRGRPITINLIYTAWSAKYCDKCMVITSGYSEE